MADLANMSVERYDYENQAWTVNWRYMACNHPASMNCKCYGKQHAGEFAAEFKTRTLRNPLKFEDVALACAARWCVAEKAALKYLKANFEDAGQALDALKADLAAQRAPDAFWVSL